MNFKATLLIFLSFSSFTFSQVKDENDSYIRFKEKHVVYADFGYNSAPFKIKYPFSSSIKRIHYKNNYSPSVGIGYAHGWFALRLNFSLKGTQRAQSRFGTTKAIDLGLNFQIKKTFFDIDFRIYQGYAIKNAYLWNDTLNALKKNDIRKNTTSASFSINAWYFKNKDFNMASVFGKTGHYKKSINSAYFKPTIALHGVGNSEKPLIPAALWDSTDSKTMALGYSALDIGLVPGYAKVLRHKNWQVCGFFGLGGVIQAKFYNFETSNRGFLGLAGRYDIRLVGGYSEDDFFVFLNTDFDNKSIRFNDLKYRQAYYSLRVTAGYRFNKKVNRNQK